MQAPHAANGIVIKTPPHHAALLPCSLIALHAATPALQTHLLALSSDLLHSRFTVGPDQSAGAGVPKSRSYAQPHRDALAVRPRSDLQATRHGRDKTVQPQSLAAFE